MSDSTITGSTCPLTYSAMVSAEQSVVVDLRLPRAPGEEPSRTTHCLLTTDRQTYAEATEALERVSPSLRGGQSAPVPLSPLEYRALVETVLAGEVLEELAQAGHGDAYHGADGVVRLVGEGAAQRARRAAWLAIEVKRQLGGRIVLGGCIEEVRPAFEALTPLSPLPPLAAGPGQPGPRTRRRSKAR